MEFSVMMHDETVGTCSLEEMGLYWKINCKCKVLSDRIERLYVGEKKLGVLEKEGSCLTLRKTVSKSSCPELPPEDGKFYLYPRIKEQLLASSMEEWEGEVLGHWLKGYRENEYILFPYEQDSPCPCEPLLCYFEIADGFWKLPMHPQTEQGI